MNKYFETLTNARGDSLPNYRAQVVDSGGSIVTIYSDKSGTRFTDSDGATINYATADSAGITEFYWTAADGQVLQVLDASGNLVRAVADFADNFVLDNLGGSIAQSAVTDLTTDLAAKADDAATASALATKAATADLASTASGKGAAMVGFNSGDTGAVDTNAAAWMRWHMVLPQDFGATGDGTTDDTAAIRKWIQAIVGRGFETGYRAPTAAGFVPRGVYRITESGVFNDLGETKRGGYKIVGEGNENSIFWLDPSGASADKWFYDNGATQRTWGCVFEDIGFMGGTDWRGGDPDTDAGIGFANLNQYINGFKFTGPGWESAHMFVRCKFRWLQQVGHFAGTNNADTVRYDHCEYDKCFDVFYIDNEQSLSVTDTAGYASVMYGTYLTYGPNCTGGGGNFTKMGGAIIMLADEAGADGFVLKMVDGGVSASNSPIIFDSVRVEARGTYGKLVKATYTAPAIIQFRGCSVANTSGSDKEMIEVGGQNTVIFDAGSFKNQGDGSTVGKATFKITSSTRLGRNPHLIFRDSLLFDYFHDKVTWNGGMGRLTVQNCGGSTLGTATTVFALDCDILGTTPSNSINNRGGSISSAPVANNAAITAAGEYTITLPPYSRILSVRARIPAQASGGSAANVQIHIGNGDKSETYATSTTGAFNAGGLAVATDLFKNVETDANERVVRIWLTDGSGGSPSTSINLDSQTMDSLVEWR